MGTSTLEKLKFFPEHSVYRQSTEALTRHRLSVIESVKPAGLEEWQARVEKIIDGHPEGPTDEDLKKDLDKHMQKDIRADNAKIPRIEPEPALTIDQISDIENQISSGLLEEIIQVAEGENELVETLAKSKVWEDLEEKPTEGQWTYFERGTHVPTTQAP